MEMAKKSSLICFFSIFIFRTSFHFEINYDKKFEFLGKFHKGYCILKYKDNLFRSYIYVNKRCKLFFSSEVGVFTQLFVFCVFSITDEKNERKKSLDHYNRCKIR